MDKLFKLDHLTNFRTLLMGFAILWIFFYHQGVNVPGLNLFFSVGWIGVDIFFLLSGFGLSASLEKNSDSVQFYRRRVMRILPTWWMILGIMHILGLYFNIKTPHNFWEYIQWYFGIGWWINGISYEWYIPTLILFYLISPLVNKMSVKCLAFSIILSIIIGVLLHEFRIFEHIYMSYQRIPVFLMGFLMYKKFKNGGVLIKLPIIYAIVILGLIIFGYSYKYKDIDLILSLEMRRYASLLFIIPLTYAISSFFVVMKQNKIFSHVNTLLQMFFCFLGTISMEIYLLHINHNYSIIMTNYLSLYMNEGFVKLIWFIIVIGLSFLLKKLIESINRV